MTSLTEFLENYWRSLGDRRAVRKSRRYPPISADRFRPAAKPVGSPHRGTELINGRIRLDGDVMDLGENPVWALEPRSARAVESLHGFDWLDDLAAEGSPASRTLAEHWTFEWIDRFGDGGPGWTATLTGRRVVRWLNHHAFLGTRLDTESRTRLETSLTRQIRFLTWRAETAPSGLPKLEALTGLTHGIAANGLRPSVAIRTARLIADWVDRNIDAHGGMAERNPERLAKVLVLLSWSAEALRVAGVDPDPLFGDSMTNAAKTLRGLRLGDGTLPRFHGGNAGPTALIDHTIAALGPPDSTGTESVMGFARMASGVSVLVIDCGPWPTVRPSGAAYASTLAFEFSSARSPILINAGPDTTSDGRRNEEARSPAAHNTLWIVGGTGTAAGDAMPIRPDPPTWITTDTGRGHFSRAFVASHDGYSSVFGLVHTRRLELLDNGLTLQGEDRLSSDTIGDGKGRRRRTGRRSATGHGFQVGFCLDPSVAAELDSDREVIRLTVAGGVWEFHQSGGTLSLRPATIIDAEDGTPVETTRILLSSRILEYESVIRWSLIQTNRHRMLV